MSEQMDQCILRWFGHIERMEDNRLARKVYESEMQGPICRGRPCKGWIDGVKEVLSKRSLNIQKAEECIKDWQEWCSVCQGNDVSLVSLLCGMMHFHGKGGSFVMPGVILKYTLKNECGCVLSLILSSGYPVEEEPYTHTHTHTHIYVHIYTYIHTYI